MPPLKKQHIADPYANMPEAPPEQDPYANMPEAFAAPANNTQGVFQMKTPEGVDVKGGVPYDQVMAAYKEGYLISPEDRLRFGNYKVSELSGKGQKGKFNPDTDLPESFHTVSATTKIPWYKQTIWNKEARPGIERGMLDLLPTVGGVAGGIAGGGAGLETGLGAIATGAAGAAAGGGLGETVRQSLTEKLFPFDQRLTAKQSAQNIGAQAVVQGGSELAGRAGSRFVFSPAINALRGTAEASEKAGFRLLPSEVEGTKPSVFETYPKASIFSSKTMANWRELQNRETEKAALNLADDVSKKSLSKTGSREESGEIVRNGIEKHMEKFRTIQNAMYNKVNKLAKGLNPSRADMVAFAKQELQRLNSAQKAGGKIQMSPFRERLQSIVDNTSPVAPFSAMKDLRSALIAQVSNSNELLSGPEKGFLKKMAGIIDSSIEDSLKKSGVKGLPELWRSANAVTREEHEIFEKKLIENLAAKKNPEDIALILRGNSPNAISQIGIQETRDAMSVIPKQMIPRVQKQILLDTMYESSKKGTESFNEKAFAKKILQIGDDRGVVLFGKNWQKIKEFSELLNKLSDSGGLQAASLSNPEVLKQVGRLPIEMALSVAGFHGSVGTTVGAVLFPVMTEAVLWKTIATALVHPEGAATLLNGMRILAKIAPYAATGALTVDRGQKRAKGEIPPSLIDQTKDTMEQMKQKGDALYQSMHLGGFAPPPPAQTTPAPQPAAQPTWTHTYDPDTGEIVAVQ